MNAIRLSAKDQPSTLEIYPSLASTALTLSDFLAARRNVPVFAVLPAVSGAAVRYDFGWIVAGGSAPANPADQRCSPAIDCSSCGH